MDNIATASLLVVTGVCIYAAMNHAFIAFGREFSRLHLLFAIVCVVLAGFEIFHILTYTAETLADYIPRLKWEVTFIILLFMVYPWFISEYSQIKPRWFLLGISMLAVVLLILNIFQPFSLQFTELIRLEHVQLSWGESISQPVGQNGIGYFISGAGILVVFAFGLYALGIRYYRDRMRTTLAMLLAVGVFMLSGIEGMLVRMSVIDFIHLGPFGILAMIIAMSMALNQEMQQKLHASENRFRYLVEQSPFSIQVMSPDGFTLQVNQAWEKLWGVTLADVTSYSMLEDQQLRDKGVMPYLEKGFAGQAMEIPPINYNPAENSEFRGPHNECWVRAYIYPIKDDSGTVREVVLLHEDVTKKKRFDDALHLIATGALAEAGEGFFQQLVITLSEFFGTKYTFVGVLDPVNTQVMHTVSVCANGKIAPNFSYELKGTPCADVLGQHGCVFPNNVQQQFPQDELLKQMGVESYVGTPLFDPQGNPIGIIVLLHDQPLQDVEPMMALMEIFAVRAAAELERNKADELLQQRHKHLQEMVEQRTVELQTAVEELESFSYSVSHDLRAPLRVIDGFSQALVEDYDDLLNNEGKDYLARIRTNAQRMAQLIDDLLQLSQVTRKDINRQPVNISDLVNSSLIKYQEQDPGRSIETHVKPNVVVKGDSDLLGIVIDNLVSNACKYTGKTGHAVIEFGATEHAGIPACYIKDNGVGFDMQYADKIFGAFQRLHSADQFEGTGIGLATVARIIHRHGGELWAEAQLNKGATFYFTCPNFESA